MHFQHNSVWASIVGTVVQLEPVELQVSLASRMNDELCGLLHGTLEPFADYLGCAVRRQSVGIVVFSDGGLIVPGTTAVDQLGFDARDADSHWSVALEGKWGVFEGVDIDEESQAADLDIVNLGDVEVDCCPLFGVCLVLTDGLVAGRLMMWVL